MLSEDVRERLAGLQRAARFGLLSFEAIAEIARRFDLDRKTNRRCLRDTEWQPYHRAVAA